METSVQNTIKKDDPFGLNQYLPKDETSHGWYGCFAIRMSEDRRKWVCFESSDYKYTGIIDDFGNVVPISSIINLRGY